MFIRAIVFVHRWLGVALCLLVILWFASGIGMMYFPWLYNHRPAWDIVVITFMLGGTALGASSLVLAWRVLGRQFRRLIAPTPVEPPASEDLV